MYEYFDEMENGSFLEHHGILGQKWGIRRFQNYDGTLKNAGKKRRAKTDKDKALVKEERAKARAERREARAAEKAEKAQKKAEEEAKQLRSDIDKAIADVDFDEIMRLKGSMTTSELQSLAQRAQALGQISENLRKVDLKNSEKKTRIDKINDAMTTSKQTFDNITGLHKSIVSLKNEFFPKKNAQEQPNQNQNQNNQKPQNQNQNNQKSQSDAAFSKLLNSVRDDIASLKKDIKASQNQSAQNNKQENQTKKEKKKGLDLWEDDTKSGPINPSSWSAPKAEKKNLKISNFTTALGKAGKIFSDTDSFGYQRQAAPTSNSKFSWDKVTSMAREKTLSEVNARNSSGWTAKNNDDWLAVLKSANEMKAHNIVYDSKRNRYV